MTSRTTSLQIPLHEEDENLWLSKTSKLILDKNWDEVDWEYLGEYLEDMSKSEQRSVVSRLIILNMHLLKWMFQKDYRTNSWKVTIMEQRRELNLAFEDSKNLKNHGEKSFIKSYEKAREEASIETEIKIETFPFEPPFSFQQAINEKYFPE